MNLENRKLALIEAFLSIDSEDVINDIENLLGKRKVRFPEESLKPMSLRQFNDEIDQALDDEKNDRLISTEDLRISIEKWR